MDVIGCIALIEYLLLSIFAGLSTYLFYMSNSYKPNFMVKATMYLLFTITLSMIAIFLMRFSTAFDIAFIFNNKDALLMIPRGLELIAFWYFIKQCVKKVN